MGELTGPAEVRAAVELVLGRGVVAVAQLPPATMAIAHHRVRLDDGTAVFVKSAARTAAPFVEAEVVVYASLSSSHLPPFLGAHRADGATFLLLADLGAAGWPPPWHESSVVAALEGLRALHRTPVPPSLPRAAEGLGGWPTWSDAAVAVDRVAPALGVMPELVQRAAAQLAPLAARAVLHGDALVHGDAHGGNVCVRQGHATWVDWSSAHCGNPDQDLALFAISVAADAGPPRVLTEPQLRLVALFAGTWAARAGQPPPTWGPGVRTIERHLLSGAWGLLAAAGHAPPFRRAEADPPRDPAARRRRA